jgi:hypothetical protein
MVKTQKLLAAIEDKNLYDFVRIGFDGDNDLRNYYDESCNVIDHEDMVMNTVEKLKEYPSFFKNTKSYKINLDEKCVGFLYIVKNPNMLVSFAISKYFRTKEVLISFFEVIKSKLNDDFTCILFKKNSRAISWLKKCGMDIYYEDNSIVKLKYSLCQ